MLQDTVIGERLDERGVSPVIGVILMVAITVILAAVIGAFVMDLGGNVSQNAQAGVSFSESSSTVTVTLNSAPRLDSIKIKEQGVTGSIYDTTAVSAGSSWEVGTGDVNSNTGTLIVVGTYNGEESVIAEYDYDIS